MTLSRDPPLKILFSVKKASKQALLSQPLPQHNHFSKIIKIATTRSFSLERAALSSLSDASLILLSQRKSPGEIQWLPYHERHALQKLSCTDPLEALETWKRYENTTDDLSIHIAHHLAKHGFLDKSLSVYKAIHPILKNYNATGSLVALLVQNYLNNGLWPMAIDCLKFAYIHNTPINVACFNSILQKLFHDNRGKDALLLYGSCIDSPISQKTILAQPAFPKGNPRFDQKQRCSGNEVFGE